MSQSGLGVMIFHLSGGSPKDPSNYIGRKIISADINDNPRDGSDKQLILGFEDGIKIAIFDDGQSCCENRYMTTDDDVSSLVGHTLTRIEAKYGPEEENKGYEVHESVFIEIGTDQGFITLVNHNEHNGYYGGFALSIIEL